MELFVAIDVSARQLDDCFTNPDGYTLKAFKVDHILYGAAHLCERIFMFADKLPTSEIHISLETTSVYSWHPAKCLSENIQGLDILPLDFLFTLF